MSDVSVASKLLLHVCLRVNHTPVLSVRWRDRGGARSLEKQKGKAAAQEVAEIAAEPSRGRQE